jgi:Domain of unknown function (DUF4145)
MSSAKKLKVHCRVCKQPTSHEVLYCKESSGRVDEDDFHWWATHQLLSCLGCEAVTYRRVESNSESLDPETGDIEESESLYPDRAEGRLPIEGYEYFPSRTRKIYKETLKALGQDAVILAAIGLRTIIESVCLEQNVGTDSLSKGIEILAKDGLLTVHQASLLHALRFMGNEAAHEMSQPKVEELLAALDIAETLLKTVYVLPEVATRIRTKR